MTGQQTRIGVLGRLGVFPLVRLPLAARRILACLAIRGEPVTRCTASAQLWPDLPDDIGRANLRRALWQLPRGWVMCVADELQLEAQTDLAEAHRLSASALKGQGLTFDELTLLSNDILPGWHEEWVLPANETFHALRVQALEAACRTLAAAGEFALATRAGEFALAAEPLRESAAEALIDAHLAQCNRYAAMQCFRSLEKRLKVELGVTPQPTLIRRIETISHR
jgi:DNA-binding SARP family transcriptional activator